MTPDPTLVDRVARRLKLALATHRALPVGEHNWQSIAAFLVASLDQEGVAVVDREVMEDVVVLAPTPGRRRFPGKRRLTLVPGGGEHDGEPERE